jgi:Zn-finger nucleic acid-binding protein
MQCPVCQVDLQISERQGIEIDYCPKCRGVWLDRGELDKIIERSNASIENYAQPPTMNVPDGRKKKYDYPDGELPYDYDDDDRYENRDRRYEGDYKRRRRRSFLDDVFDIFD